MYQPRPAAALVASKQEEALTHGQVMFGLIKPTKDLHQVESTAALVNVIPRKRIYVMMKAEELDLFTAELMKRPLVVQPLAYIGRGIAAINFTLCTNQEQWIMMINQTHPKILGIIQSGIAGAKEKMALGKPFILEFSFNAFLKRVYLNRLTKTALDARFTVIDFENAEIIIRYPGNAAHRGLAWEMKTPELKFTFNDLQPEDLIRRTVHDGTLEWEQPALRIVPPDELGQYLPGWNFAEDDLKVPSIEEVEGATGGYDIETEPAPSGGGRMVGRRGRGKNSGKQTDVQVELHNNHRKYEVPIELHVPQTGGPQVLQKGSTASTPSPLVESPLKYEDSNPPPNYDEPDYRGRVKELKYDDNRFPVLSVPNQTHLGKESLQNQQYHGQGGLRDVPRTPTTPKYSADTPQTSTTQKYSSPSPTTPTYNGDIQRQTSPRSNSRNDRYGNVPESRSHDDGGFLSHSRQQHKVDANSNRTGEVDRYGNPVITRTSPYAEQQAHGYGKQFVNRDRQQRYPESQTYSPRGDNQYNLENQYTRDSGDKPVAPPRNRKAFKPIDRPEPLPRGLHHQQGSGRSVSSTSDSGFGETENGMDSYRQKTDMYGDHGLQFQQKTPQYNHAYTPESPERSPVREQPGQSVDDIMAQHKALAAKMLRGDVPQEGNKRHHGYTQHDNSNHSDYYGNELQRYRQNINDLEDACDVTGKDFSALQLKIHPQGKQMDESFI